MYPFAEASVTMFNTLWVSPQSESKGAGRRTKVSVAVTLILLVGPTIIVGYGNYMGTR